MSDPTPTDAGATRREFAQLLVLAAATPLAAGLPEAPAQSPATSDLAARALALAEFVHAHYGRHLTADQQAAVQRSIAGELHTADRLARFPLTNADEPAFTFSADVR